MRFERVGFELLVAVGDGDVLLPNGPVSMDVRCVGLLSALVPVVVTPVAPPLAFVAPALSTPPPHGRPRPRRSPRWQTRRGVPPVVVPVRVRSLRAGNTGDAWSACRSRPYARWRYRPETRGRETRRGHARRRHGHLLLKTNNFKRVCLQRVYVVACAVV